MLYYLHNYSRSYLEPSKFWYRIKIILPQPHKIKHFNMFPFKLFHIEHVIDLSLVFVMDFQINKISLGVGVWQDKLYTCVLFINHVTCDNLLVGRCLSTSLLLLWQAYSSKHLKKYILKYGRHCLPDS